jgi:hypothetical protein
MTRVMLGTLGLLIVLTVGSCVSARGNGPSARNPNDHLCLACQSGGDCSRDKHCVGGCCKTVDDENLFE